MLSLGGRLQEVVAYENLHTCRPYWVKILPHYHEVTTETYPMFSMFYSTCRIERQLLEKTIWYFTLTEKFPSHVHCAIQECDNDTTAHYLIFTLLSVKWSQLLPLKLVVVAYKRWLYMYLCHISVKWFLKIVQNS